VEETMRNQILQLQGETGQLKQNYGNELAKLRAENQELMNKLKVVAEQTEQLLKHVDKQAQIIKTKEGESEKVRHELQGKIEKMQTERQMERLADEKEIQDLKQTVGLLEEARQTIHEDKEEEDPPKADQEAIKKAISALDEDED
ncbi:MAG: hypothetical protein ACXAEI_17900, partial [Candidatus Hodarchaeales archaeon]